MQFMHLFSCSVPFKSLYDQPAPLVCMCFVSAGADQGNPESIVELLNPLLWEGVSVPTVRV